MIAFPLETSAPAEPIPAMTPFTRVSRNVMIGMIERETLLAQGDEFFQRLFGGRTPTLAEKLHYVEEAIARMASPHIYTNNLYNVVVTCRPPFIHLDINRHDGGPCRTWRHFQQIKNELVGPEYEAIELFPAESRLVDTSNEYHLWVHADAGFRFPLGFQQRFVLEKPILVEHKIGTLRAAAGEARNQPTDRIAHAAVASAL